MSKSEVRPREFWIDPTDDAGEEDLFFGDALKEHPRQGPLQWQDSLIRVIEYSAYDSLKKENERLKKHIEELREDLTFEDYAESADLWIAGKQNELP
jgi:hypothetical protein